ncbi:SUMF1/EgtB/PvdO family nonheme iron enzyme [candidate division CSSED10-310 bacterium]|uniref:SUMF1/EgtB/PvdO family nonheme iron enzyme n=1 Tax=candidate division CSSED10-310 bacterium TaxID=2855610 RepID=A0ABV6YU05_UNCC1
MICPFCQNEISEELKKKARCPYCYPDGLDAASDEGGMEAITREVRSESYPDRSANDQPSQKKNEGELRQTLSCHGMTSRNGDIVSFETLNTEDKYVPESTPSAQCEFTEQFPGYSMKGEIGRGGFGSVHLARDKTARRDIALKTFNPAQKGSSLTIFRGRFLEEARITAQLQHPGIIPIYTIACDTAGNYFYTMRPVKGEALSMVLTRLKEGDVRTEQHYSQRYLMQILISVCKTMRFAHDHGVIHRDLKPSNIIVGNYDEILVIDWGLAKVIGQATQLSQEDTPEISAFYGDVWAQYQRDVETERADDESRFQVTVEGQIMGTPIYMSPEQVRGTVKEIDFLSDIWTIGVILYECATLRLPFSGAKLDMILHQILHEDPPHPAIANPGHRVPAELADIIKRCLQKDKKDRYQSIRELLLDLERWYEGIAPWRLTEQFDFSILPDGKPEGLTITHGIWEIRDGILCAPEYGGILTCQKIEGDVRIEVDARVLRSDNGEISLLLSAPDPDKSQFFFDGYVMRVLSDGTTKVNIHKGNVDLITRSCDLDLGSWQTVAAERIGNTVRIERDGVELLKYRDFFAMKGQRTGLLSMAPGLRIKGLRVYTRGSSIVLSCLDLAQSYHDKGMIPEAQDSYRQIYSDHADREEGVEALFRAGLLDLERAKTIDRNTETALYEKLLDDARGLFDRVEQSFFAPLGLLGKAIVHEHRGELDREINELLRAFREYPDYDTIHVIPERLRVRGHVWKWEYIIASDDLVAGIERILQTHLPAVPNQTPLKGLPLDMLSLSAAITSIDGLKGLDLKILNLSQTRVENLEPLQGMSVTTLSLPRTVSDARVLKDLHLKALDISLSTIPDIRPLSELPLKHLALPANIADISCLKKLPLEHLDMFNTCVEDIRVVSELPLKLVRLPRSLAQIPPLKNPDLDFLQIPAHVTDISGLRGMRLRGIDLRESLVSDLKPLQGMELGFIGLPSSVHDISALSGMPLRSLDLFHTDVNDLTPLQTMPHLKYLNIYPGNLSQGWATIVHSLKDLKILTCDEWFTSGLPRDFWHLYEAGQLEGSRQAVSELNAHRRTFTNSQGIPLRWVPPDVYLMGSPLHEPGRESREKQHFVCLSRGFYMSTMLVRVCDYEAFVRATGYRTDAEKEGWAYTKNGKKIGRTEGANWRTPGFDQSPNQPVVCVSWNDAVAYCEWLSTHEKRPYRLPTESEWEYSCRAGTETPFSGDLEQICWSGDNSDDRTHEVCQKQSNAWGFYDMHGNVWEWCLDWYGEYPPGFSIDPNGPDTGNYRIHRGGSWFYLPVRCRSAYRSYFYPSGRASIRGFRIVAES